MKGKMSGWRNVLSGVPQGSVQGPVLFLLFIDDLDRAASLRQIIKQFADDTKIAQTIEKLEDSMELMQAIIAWTGCASGQPNGACHLMLKNAKLCTLAYTLHSTQSQAQLPDEWQRVLHDREPAGHRGNSQQLSEASSAVQKGGQNGFNSSGAR